MTVKFSRPTHASPKDVLAAIEQNGREWRESLVPAELRREGVIQVEAQIRNSTFILRYVRKWYGSEGGEALELRGYVVARADGGSVVVAESNQSRVLFIGAALFGAIGALVIASGGSGGAVAIGIALVLVVLAAIRDRAHTRNGEDRYLLARLEQAIVTAEAAAGPRTQSV